MKTNYQIKMEEIVDAINDNNPVPKLLLHSCCAPCSSYVLETLSEFFEITIFYYNPNIGEVEEYQKRVVEQKRLISCLKTKHSISFLEGTYDPSQYDDAVRGYETLKEGSERCFRCYRLRLHETAKIAKENNYDFFTTTLSISPHKNSEVLNKIGEELEKEFSVSYLYADFKKKNGTSRSIELSKMYGLYRQDYCGCIYSKQAKLERDLIHKS